MIVQAALARRRRAEFRPFLSEQPALLKSVAAPVRCLHLVAERMRQRHFGDIARNIGAVAGPIPEAVRGQIATAHTAQQHQECHVAERLAGALSAAVE
jgi:hypothetical protein